MLCVGPINRCCPLGGCVVLGSGLIGDLSKFGLHEPSVCDRAGVWFDPARILWTYSDELWADYLIPYQPVSVLISGDDVIVERWFGAVGEAELRAALERLRQVG